MTAITLVITVYNCEAYLAEAIASVLAQTYRAFELVIWDDGSTDRSLAIARQFEQQDERVRAIAALHQGRVAALQGAIAQTHSDYLGWVDSDDVLHPAALAQTLAVLEAQPTVGMVYTDYWDMDAQGQVLGYGKRCQVPYSKEGLLVSFMTHHFRLMRRHTFNQAKGLEGCIDFVEDYDLCLRLSEITQIHHLQQPLYFYRQHAHNASRDRSKQKLSSIQTVVQRALERRGLSDRWQARIQPNGHIHLDYQNRSAVRLVRGMVSVLFAASLMAGPIALAQAQSITPAANGTNTQVLQTGGQYTITGGAFSSDGRNLFHDFQRFGLTQGERATFLANPQLHNILGRVSGGEPSYINGLIQVTGGTPNLYFLNPAGIVFGASASLHVPAAFTATTATGLSFGNTGWRDGIVDYSTLTGAVTGFEFASGASGAIANLGNLGVSSGQSLNLLAGTLVNTGTLSAPGGQITLFAVPSGNTIRLSQPGSLLSFEILPATTSRAGTAPSLAQLLTGGGLPEATGVTLNPDGSVRLQGTTATVTPAVGTTLVGGQVDVVGEVGGTVQLLGERVALLGASVQASGNQGGGTVLVGGDYRGLGTVPNAMVTSVDATSAIAASALTQGDGGRVILWANHTTRFDGTISAQGGSLLGNGGFVEVSGRHDLVYRGRTNVFAPAGRSGTLLLDPENITIVGSGYTDPAVLAALPDILATDFLGQSITIVAEDLGFTSGSVILEATNDINILTSVSFFSSISDVTLRADADNNGIGQVTMSPGTQLTITAGFGYGTPFINISGASLVLGDINARGELMADGGQVTLTSRNGNTVFNSIDTSSAMGRGGAVEINATGLVRGLGLVPDTSSTILATGAVGGGPITIRHLGGEQGIPFVVGDATTNGTVGAITSVASTSDIRPTRSFPGSETVGQISIITPTPTPEPTPEPTPTPSPTPMPPSPEDQQDLVDDIDGELNPFDFDFDFDDSTPFGEGGIDIAQLEDGLDLEFDDYLDLPDELPTTKLDTPDLLAQIHGLTGAEPALVYAAFVPPSVAAGTDRDHPLAKTKQQLTEQSDRKLPRRATSDQDVLELLVVTGKGQPIRRLVAGATRSRVLATTRRFINEVSDPRKVRTRSYLAPAQQLYRWLVAPIEPELQKQSITNLVYIAETGLRLIPLAALHDGNQFLAEKYSTGLMPSLNLTDTRYVPLKNAKVLAVGASNFRDLPPLPAVPTELALVSQELWQGRSLLNSAFTLENLKAARETEPYQIIHMATHGEFQSGRLSNSYIQLWDTQLRLDQIRQLGWNNPPVELLVLSACRTAIGSDDAELGFAGFAVQAGVKTAVASLWYVSDDGTLGLMSEFYRQLQTAPIKAEALRQAQVAMVRGDVKITGQQLQGTRGAIPLPSDLAIEGDRALAHPYYWAAFTMVGSPW